MQGHSLELCRHILPVMKMLATIYNEVGKDLPILKGVVWSKISRGYVKVDGLGETLLFTGTKLE